MLKVTWLPGIEHAGKPPATYYIDTDDYKLAEKCATEQLEKDNPNHQCYHHVVMAQIDLVRTNQ